MRYFVLFIFSIKVFADIYATFDVYPKKDASLAFSSSGVVKKVYVDVGSVVKKGDILVSLKNDEIKALVEIAKTKLHKAKLALKYAKREYDRQLKVKHLLDDSVFDKVQSAYEFALIEYNKAKANLAYKEELLEKTYLKAPFDGIIYAKMVEAGDVVSSAMIRTILKLESKDEIQLHIYFDQKYHNKVKVGDKFIYKLDGENKTKVATIKKIYPNSNINNRKMTAIADVDNEIVGLFGEGYIRSED